MPYLYRHAILLWRWHRVKKAGNNLQKFMSDYFSNLPPRESEFCKDCIHSVVSMNNGNLLCLNERSRFFGKAIAPEKDMEGFCWFERMKPEESEEKNKYLNKTEARNMTVKVTIVLEVPNNFDEEQIREDIEQAIMYQSRFDVIDIFEFEDITGIE
jgi:hypothetical protein